MSHSEPAPEEQRPFQSSLCTSLRKAPHWKCFLLTLMIVGCMAAIGWCRLSAIHRYRHKDQDSTETSPCDDGYVYIPSAFVILLYLVYLVECWHCSTRVALRYKTDVESVYERIRLLRQAKPVIWWRAECYHYVRRTRQITRYRDGDAFTSIQVYYERVNTHSSTSAFNYQYSGVKDISKNLKGLEEHPIIKIKFTKGFSFACVDAEREFEDQRFAFFQENDRRDDFMQSFEGLELGHCDFKDFLVAFSDTDRPPWYVTQAAFWICSFLLLSWPIRVMVEYKTAAVDYVVHKVFGLNYISEITSAIPRVNTMGSSELEFNIINNNGIVPSYSEAILMECATNPPRWTSDANGNITPTLSPMKSSASGLYYPSYGSINNGATSGKPKDIRNFVPRLLGSRFVSAKSEPDLFAQEFTDLSRRNGRKKRQKVRLKNGVLIPPRRSQSSISTLGSTALQSPEGIRSEDSPSVEQPPPYDVALDMRADIGSPSSVINFGRLPPVRRRNAEEDCQELLDMSDNIQSDIPRSTTTSSVRQCDSSHYPRCTGVDSATENARNSNKNGCYVNVAHGAFYCVTPRPHSVYITSDGRTECTLETSGGEDNPTTTIQNIETRL